MSVSPSQGPTQTSPADRRRSGSEDGELLNGPTRDNSRVSRMVDSLLSLTTFLLALRRIWKHD